VNFKNLIHTRELISDDPYVLSSQVYYVRDDKNPDWCCVVRTKPRNVYDVGQGEGNNDEGLNYHESEPLNLNVGNNIVYCACNDVLAFEVEQQQ
jgi:hypothetical protein